MRGFARHAFATWAASFLAASAIMLGCQAQADDKWNPVPALQPSCPMAADPSPPAGPAPAATPAQPPASWWDSVTPCGHIEAGITGNPDAPSSPRNFGRQFDDHANAPVLNQLWGVIERSHNHDVTDLDFGFRVDAAFGTDARFLHVYNQFDHAIDSSYQIALFEAYGSAYVPGVGADGMDVKLGQFASPLGFESTDASPNSFYSHSYISVFGVPSQHTGFLTITHASSVVDLYFGLDTGVNAWLGSNGLNNDTVLHGIAGIGFNLLGRDLMFSGLTHIGPENPKSVFGAAADRELRYMTDFMLTWKVSDEITLDNELNYVHDDGLRASAYGGTQYFIYSISKMLAFAVRGEIWRDNNGAFVASFAQPFDFVNAARGLATSPGGVVKGGRTTYGELTIGFNIKPPATKPFENFVIRPELRVDDSLNGTKPFVNGTRAHQVTLATDFVLPFTF